MNKIITLLSLLILLGMIPVSGQNHVADINELTNIPFNAVPDVHGKLLLSGDHSVSLFTPVSKGGITVVNGWPEKYNGVTYRGGIYCDLDDDPDLEIVYNIGQKTYAWDIDGTLLPGWPQQVQEHLYGAPSYGDVDGDGEGEIVVSTRQVPYGNNGWLYVFKKDGTPATGFPIALTQGGAVKTPVLADLDGDDVLEILITESNYPDGYLVVYKGDASIFPGWPYHLDDLAGSPVAVGDITGDEIPEIVVESYISLYAFDINGNVLNGFPFTPGNHRVFSYSTPVLVDLDNDGLREIVFGDHQTDGAINGAVHILRNDGSIFPGWPQYTDHWVYGPPAVADIDGDGSLDIAVGDQTASSSPFNHVYVWDINGNYLPGWPTEEVMAVNNQIIIADLDGDHQVELMWDDNTSDAIYLGYNHDGTVMDGWPLEIHFSTFFMNPFVADVDNDGIANLSGGGIDIWGTNDCEIYLWSTGTNYHPELSYVPVLQYNVQHTGVYKDPQATGIEDFRQDKELIIYPNPSDGIYYISPNTENPASISIEIFDLNSKRIFASQQLPGRDAGNRIDISAYPDGIYIMRQQNDHQVITRKLIKTTP